MEPHEHAYEFNDYCAAHICTYYSENGEPCDDHKGLARCWCGWSLTDPGRGFQELEDMGENMEGLP